MKLFIPISKVVDRGDGTCDVFGIAANEAKDDVGEIFDYASSKPLFQEWSDDAVKRSDGASLGNIRAMHNKLAAGKATQLDFDDAGKAIHLGAHIVDANEAKKCLERVYTGFSIGGSYVKRWPDTNARGAYRYTAKPVEISIVDIPSNPDATITMVKMDGSSSVEKFAEPTVESRLNKLQYMAEKQAESYGDLVKYLSSGNLEKGGDPMCPKCHKAKDECNCEETEKAKESGSELNLKKEENETTAEKGIRHLVTDEKGNKHLPVTDENGKPDPHHMGAAWAALHSNYRGHAYQGPDKDKAIAALDAMYEQAGMDKPSEKFVTSEDLTKSLDEHLEKFFQKLEAFNATKVETQVAKSNVEKEVALVKATFAEVQKAINSGATAEEIKKSAGSHLMALHDHCEKLAKAGMHLHKCFGKMAECHDEMDKLHSEAMGHHGEMMKHASAMMNGGEGFGKSENMGDAGIGGPEAGITGGVEHDIPGAGVSDSKKQTEEGLGMGGDERHGADASAEKMMKSGFASLENKLARSLDTIVEKFGTRLDTEKEASEKRFEALEKGVGVLVKGFNQLIEGVAGKPNAEQQQVRRQQQEAPLTLVEKGKEGGNLHEKDARTVELEKKAKEGIITEREKRELFKSIPLTAGQGTAPHLRLER
jgi:hypothetical protein